MAFLLTGPYLFSLQLRPGSMPSTVWESLSAFWNPAWALEQGWQGLLLAGQLAGLAAQLRKLPIWLHMACRAQSETILPSISAIEADTRHRGTAHTAWRGLAGFACEGTVAMFLIRAKLGPQLSCTRSKRCQMGSKVHTSHKPFVCCRADSAFFFGCSGSMCLQLLSNMGLSRLA